MGWFFRKSLKLGPLRLNLSKSGLGVSAGVRGLRVGVDAKGRRYVAGGRGGLYFREQIGKSPPAPPEEPTSERPTPVAGRPGGWAWFWFVVALAAVLVAAFELAR